MKNWYIINELKDFINSTRVLVFNSFLTTSDGDIEKLLIQPQKQEEFDSILSYEESLVIVNSLLKKQKNKTTNETRYLCSDKLFYSIVQALNDRMVSNILNSLVNKGLLDSGFDEKTNDFIFWIKNLENKNEQ